MIKIAPSILAADFSKLGEEVSAMEKAGAEMIHLDVMDGHFVPNISFGAAIIKSVRHNSKALFDTHLMISSPLKYAEDFVKAGSDRVTFHLESEDDTEQVIALIKSLGAQVGISLKPATSARAVFPYLKSIDQLLIMTVEPGFGGQSFMEEMCPKILEVARFRAENKLEFDIQVDGGIDETTAFTVSAHGANVMVAGSSLFSQNDYREGVEGLRCQAQKGALEFRL